MATVNAVVLKHHKKEDGTWNVKISVSHKSQTKYIDTSSYVTKTDLDSKGRLKKSFIVKHYAIILNRYRQAITEYGTKIKFVTCEDVKSYLKNLDAKDDIIDLFGKFDERISEYQSKGREGQAKNILSVVNHLRDFTGLDRFDIANLTTGFLYEFKRYLESPKVIVRNNNVGGYTKPQERHGINANTQIVYFGIISNLVKDLRKRYNNQAIGYLPVPNPFENFDSIKPVKTKRRILEISMILALMKYQPVGKMETVTRDLFLLSFFLCGMNPVDMFSYLTDPRMTGELEYARTKIKNRRIIDGGVTNVLIPPCAQELIEKHAGAIQRDYRNIESLHSIFRDGWKRIRAKLGFNVSMYYGRHSFATVARKLCGISKDDVSFALNHKFGLDVTDIYAEPNWEIVHHVQKTVIDRVFSELEEKEVA